MELSIKEAITDKIISESGAHYGVSFEDIKYVGGFENFVYEYQKDGIDYILRLVHSTHRISDHVMGEIEFIDYLSHNGANVSNVVKTLEGELQVQIACDTPGDYFTVCTFTRAPGTYVGKRTDDEFNYKFGSAVEKLHRLTKKYSPIKKRYHWHEENFVDIGKKYLPGKYQYMIAKCEAHIEKLKKLPIDIDCYGLIHTDLHFGNLYYDDSVITFFDWDDSAYKHFISDIAIIIYYQFGLTMDTDVQIEDKTYNFLKHFMKGYEIENKLDQKWFEYLNDFLLLRTFILFFVIYGAGEDMVNSSWGQMFINKFENRIKNDTPLFDQERAVRR